MPAHLFSQMPPPRPAMNAAIALPDAPAPQIEVAQATRTIDPQSGQAQNTQQPATGDAPNAQQPAAGAVPSPDATGGATQNRSSPQSSAQQPNTQETQHQKAEQQLKQEEHQRIAGIVPSFNVSYYSDAVSLTPAEKFRLEFHSIRDPYTFAISTIVAGLGEAEDSNTGFGWGPEGFTKRAAAAYADNVIGNTLGNAALPSLLHQDPRYFRLGPARLATAFSMRLLPHLSASTITLASGSPIIPTSWAT